MPVSIAAYETLTMCKASTRVGASLVAWQSCSLLPMKELEGLLLWTTTKTLVLCGVQDPALRVQDYYLSSPCCPRCRQEHEKRTPPSYYRPLTGASAHGCNEIRAWQRATEVAASVDLESMD